MASIRVALAEDNVLLREGISRLVAADDDFELVGVSSDLPELVALIAEREPHVVVADIRMPPAGTDEGIQAAEWLLQNRPDVGVVVLSQFTAPSYAMALLEDGSAGRAYLLKERGAGVDELVSAIRTVANGVAGASGAIGTQFVPRLVAAGDAVVGVDDDPAQVADRLPALAGQIRAKRPTRVARFVGRLFVGQAGVVMMTELRAGSNAKAKRGLAWRPAHPNWGTGLAT
jgi:CheY-like chemotaxis protein